MTSQRTLSLVQAQVAAPPPSLKEQLCTSIRSNIQDFIGRIPLDATGATPYFFSERQITHDKTQAGRVFLLEVSAKDRFITLLPISAPAEDLGDFCDKLHRHTQKSSQNGCRALAIALIPQASGSVRLRASVFGNSSSGVASPSSVTIDVSDLDYTKVKLGHFLNDVLKVFDPSHPRFLRDAKFSLPANRKFAP